MDWQCDSITVCTDRPAVATNWLAIVTRRTGEVPRPRWRSMNVARLTPARSPSCVSAKRAISSPNSAARSLVSVAHPTQVSNDV